MIAKAPKSKVIDGHTFEVGLLPGRTGFAMYLELAKMLAPAAGATAGKLDMQSIAPLIAGKGANEALAVLLKLDVGPLLESAVTALVENVHTPKVMEIAEQLAAASLMDGRPMGGQLDVLFAGEPWLMAKWLVFGLEASFGGFFGFLSRLGKRDEGTAAPEVAAKA